VPWCGEPVVEGVGQPRIVENAARRTLSGKVAVGTLHLVRGLEFRAVMACDYEIIPSQARIETISDEADLEEVYNTERPPPLCGLHTGARSSPGHKRGSAVGVPRRPASGGVTSARLAHSIAQHLMAVES
jgi:hypothetical protein